MFASMISTARGLLYVENVAY